MPRIPVVTGHTCLMAEHRPTVSSEARFLIRGACACRRVIYACRNHLPMAVDEMGKDCGHMRFGEVIVRALLPK